MAKKRVLITGMSGLIGGVARRQLEGDYELRALNRSVVPGVDCVQADISDPDAILPAFEGVDTVVHLAANATGGASWEQLHQANVVGTYNVFEAARQAGVKRVVYASSGSTIANYELEMPYAALVDGRIDEAGGSWPMITHLAPPRPSGLYGTSKVWGEVLARHFVDSSDLSIFCLRIGHVTADDRPGSLRDQAIWCSQRDIARMIELCVAAPADLRYDIFFVVSNNPGNYRDLSHADEVLGFAPLDSAADFD